MIDFFEDLYDDENKDDEPSFSLHDFKKWLSKQKNDTLNESFEESCQKSEKQNLKKKFKKRIADKMRKKKS